MRRFLAVTLALLMAPSLALASVGGYHCIDGILRPHCCCPQEEVETASSTQQAEFQALPCCEYTPGTEAHPIAECAEVTRALEIVAALLSVGNQTEDIQRGDSFSLRAESTHPPPLQRVFLRHRSLLI